MEGHRVSGNLCKLIPGFSNINTFCMLNKFIYLNILGSLLNYFFFRTCGFPKILFSLKVIYAYFASFTVREQSG